MPAYRLVSHDLCPYVQRAVITLTEKRVPFEHTYIDLANKPDWFLKISPLGKTPVLIVDDVVLFESTAICDYLDDVEAPRLHPGEPLARAQHRGQVEFASATLNTIGAFYNAPDTASIEQQRIALVEKFQILESELTKNAGPYFSGPAFSLVDTAFGPVFRYFDVFDTIRDFHIFENMHRLAQWRTQLAQRPSIRDAAVWDYAKRLRAFLLRRNSALSDLIVRAEPSAA